MKMDRRLASTWPFVPLSLLVLNSACSTITGRIQPAHFQFTPIVAQRGVGAGGWRAACVHARVRNGTTGLLCESFKTAYRLRLGAAIPGSRVPVTCAPSARPVMFGEFTP